MIFFAQASNTARALVACHACCGISKARPQQIMDAYNKGLAHSKSWMLTIDCPLQSVRNDVGAQVYQISDIDSFAANVKLPRKIHPLGRTFFQERFMSKTDGHLKCFAGETLTSVKVLAFFCVEIFLPANLLPEECECMLLLAKILTIYCMGDNALYMVDSLRSSVARHHELFVRLHEDLAKKKIHYADHCVEHLADLQKNMSCWAGERMHRWTKLGQLEVSEKWLK